MNHQNRGIESRFSECWQPTLIRADDQKGLSDMQRWLKELSGVVFDKIMDQLKELVCARRPGLKPSDEELSVWVKEHLKGVRPADYGVWVWFPWNRCCVHVLPEQEYVEIRCDRNRYKITTDEQKTLMSASIGIVGLSAGRASALIMALEGVGGRFRLADFDTISLSNLNRINTSITNLGVNKAVLAARDMYAINPYLDIKVFPEGLHADNLQAFLLQDGKLDVLIEECDDLYMKFAIRQQARRLGIAVVMDTNERGLLDVERFDREPQRPWFHGNVGDVEVEKLKGLSKKEKVALVMRIIHADILTARSIASLMEVDETISSWPQLASGSALGSAAVTDTVRRMLLGTFNESGRYIVDLDEIIRDGASRHSQPEFFSPEEVSAEARFPPGLTVSFSSSRDFTHEQIRQLVSFGLLAPSGHNCQPWRFVYRQGVLECSLDPERAGGMLDFQNSASCLSIGAAVENMALASMEMGFSLKCDLRPIARDINLVCKLQFARSAERVEGGLFQQIQRRVTNRKVGDGHPLSQKEEEIIRAVVESQGGCLWLYKDAERLREAGQVLGQGDRFVFLSETLHREIMAGFRWNRRQVEATRDGLDIATLELSPSDLIGLKLASRWSAMKILDSLGRGEVLERVSRKVMRGASAIGLLAYPGQDKRAYFQAGRIMQRLWLTLSHLRIGLQPLTVLPYLFARLDRGAGEGLSDKERSLLSVIRDRFRQLFPTPRGYCEALMFRLVKAEAPSIRSLRRSVDEMLVFDQP